MNRNTLAAFAEALQWFAVNDPQNRFDPKLESLETSPTEKHILSDAGDLPHMHVVLTQWIRNRIELLGFGADQRVQVRHVEPAIAIMGKDAPKFPDRRVVSRSVCRGWIQSNTHCERLSIVPYAHQLIAISQAL